MPTANSKAEKPAISTTQAASLSAVPPPSHTCPAPRLTGFQLKAIKTLSQITSKDREPKPKLSEWKLPESGDPNVELMVFPLQNFEGYKPGGKAGTSAKSRSNKSSDEDDDSEEDESSEDDAEPQAQASASSSQSRASHHQVKQNASGRVPMSKPQVGSSSKMQLNFGFKPQLTKEKLPTWPGAYEKEHSASEGEQTNSSSSSQGESDTSGEDGGQADLKRQLWQIIDSSPTWPPNWENLEAAVRLLNMQKLMQELDEIKKKAQRERKSTMDCLPDVLWPLRAIGIFESTSKMYEGAPSSGEGSVRYQARQMGALGLRIVVRDIMPDLEGAAAAARARRAMGSGGGEESDSDGAQKTEKGSKKTGKKGQKGRKK